MTPGCVIAWGDDVDVPRKTDMRRALANAGVKIIDIRSPALAEWKAMAGKADSSELGFQIVKRAAFIRRYAAAANQILSVG